MKHVPRYGFTLLEVVFVVVVLGIVASIGSSVIVRVFESYIIQKATHNAALKTELAINQLANRLVYRIGQSVVARKADGSMLPLNSVDTTTSDDFNILEWIAYDNDSFSSSNLPGWSGFVDLDNSSSTKGVISTGSDLAHARTVISKLGGSAALNFVGITDYRTGVAKDINCLHNTTGAGCIYPVDMSGTTLSLKGGDIVSGAMVFSEYYQLARSAYAVVPVASTTIAGTWDLTLYYNYAPWTGQTFSTPGVSKSILLRNVSVFRFKSDSGNSIRIKLCTIERISDTENISICKEKAVIR